MDGTYIKREAQARLAPLLEDGKAVLVLGARQVGKTTLVEQALAGRKALFLNFDIEPERARFLAAAAVGPEQARKLFGEPEFLVLDEAQRLPSAGQIVKGWLDARTPMKILMLGSSSPHLLEHSAESLTGRNWKMVLPPLVFRERVSGHAWYSQEIPETVLLETQVAALRTCLMEAMVFGSYPEVVTTGRKTELVRELAADYLWKDVLAEGLVKSPAQLRRLLQLLAFQAGSEVSVHELAQQLQMARATVERYLDLLEQTFVVFRLPAFSTNPRKEIAKSRKVYFWDTGIRNAILNDFSMSELRADIGRLWENWAVAEVAKWNLLRGGGHELFFWRNRSQAEVDLVLRRDGALRAFDCKWGGGRIAQQAFLAAYGAPVGRLHPSAPFLEGTLAAEPGGTTQG